MPAATIFITLWLLNAYDFQQWLLLHYSWLDGWTGLIILRDSNLDSKLFISLWRYFRQVLVHKYAMHLWHTQKAKKVVEHLWHFSTCWRNMCNK